MFIRFCIKLVPILLVCYSYGNTTDSLKLYSDSGLLNKKQGNLMLSEQHYKKAIQFANNDLTKAKLYNAIGIVYKKQGKYDLALSSYLKAKNMTKDSSNLINAYANMSTIYRIKGDYKKAILHNYKALNLVTSKKWKASILNNMANIFYSVKDYKQALTYYEQSFDIKKEFDPLNISYSYLNMALCFGALNRNKEAEDYFIKAIKGWGKIYGEKDYRLILAYTNYGIYLTEKAPEKALEALLRANQLALLNYGEKHPETAETFTYLSNYYVAQKEYETAIHNYQKALIANSEGFNDEDIYHNTGLNGAISKLQRLETLHKKAIALRKYASTLNEDKKVFGISLATYELAIQSLFKLQNSFMDDSKRTLIANKKEMFTEAAYVAIQLGDYKKAFQIIEKGKASTLLAAMNNNEAIKFSDIPDSLVRLENEYKRLQFVHSANDNTDSVLFYQAKHDSLIGYFEAKYKKYYNLKYGNEFPDPCEHLDTNQVLLEYALTDTLCITLVVTKDGYKHYSFPIDSTFNKNTEIFIQDLRNIVEFNGYNEQYERIISNGYYLWKKLIEPIHIPEEKSIIIIPDGILSYLNFETLIYKLPEYTHVNYYLLKYLLYKNPISYSYSASWLFEPYNETPSNNIIAFAADYRDKKDFMILESSVDEAKEITSFFRGKSFINSKCTKESFFANAPEYSIIHLALHGDIDKDSPGISKLGFYNNNLYSWEVYGMNFKARMAYLGACKTGYGKLDKGEGIFSMGRAFAYAGCPSIVMSLWADKDNLSHITLDFYKYLRKGYYLDKAMQLAKINHLEQKFNAHPHYWANKIVMGKTEPLCNKYNYWLIAFFIILLSVAYLKFIKK